MYTCITKNTSRLLVKVEHLNTPQLSSVYVLEDLCYSRYLMQIFVNSIKRLNSPVPDRVKPSFVFLTFGHSYAQPLASECPDVKNYKWRLNTVWYRMLYSCAHYGNSGPPCTQVSCVYPVVSEADLRHISSCPAACVAAPLCLPNVSAPLVTLPL